MQVDHTCPKGQEGLIENKNALFHSIYIYPSCIGWAMKVFKIGRDWIIPPPPFVSWMISTSGG